MRETEGALEGSWRLEAGSGVVENTGAGGAQKKGEEEGGGWGGSEKQQKTFRSQTQKKNTSSKWSSFHNS